MSSNALKSTEGTILVNGGKVWYRMTGDRDNVPLLILHGGPGAASLDSDVLRTLSDERPVIHYDQLGSGRSDRPVDAALWTVPRFVEELAMVRNALHLDRVHLLGHSWGTMLAASYLLQQPIGVLSVIYSSPVLKTAMWEDDQREYLRALPESMQQSIEQCERSGRTDAAEYQEAMMAFYHRHLCRMNPWPDDMYKMMNDTNAMVYNTMWGSSEFTITGTLRTFDVTDKMDEINLPSLFLCGRFDEATPHTTAYYASLVKHSELHIFENSAHMTFLEEPEAYAAVVRSFLRRKEKSPEQER